jgi:hypothetical protein
VLAGFPESLKIQPASGPPAAHRHSPRGGACAGSGGPCTDPHISRKGANQSERHINARGVTASHAWGETELTPGWITQPYFDKGKAEGRAEGEANILVRLIERRFGDVPPHLRQRIFAADVATLEKWADRVLDARDLQAMFESS